MGRRLRQNRLVPRRWTRPRGAVSEVPLCNRAIGAANRVQYLQLGSESAVDVGTAHGKSVAHYWGYQRQIRQHVCDWLLARRAGEIRPAGALERSRYAGSGKWRDEAR